MLFEPAPAFVARDAHAKAGVMISITRSSQTTEMLYRASLAMSCSSTRIDASAFSWLLFVAVSLLI